MPERLREPETRWYVLTGGPSAGKSKLISYLWAWGYHIVPEAARLVIDEAFAQGKTLDEIRGTPELELQFQQTVLERKYEQHRQLDPNRLTFFDRGLAGDTLAYWPQAIAPEGEAIVSTNTTYIVEEHRYAGVFLLDRLPLEDNYARIEDETKAEKLQRLLEYWYTVLRYPIIKVPVLSPYERTLFILNHLDTFKGLTLPTSFPKLL